MLGDRKYSSRDHKLRQAPSSVSREEYFGQQPSSHIRGYRKIADAAEAFNFDFKNKVVLDIGSSTGGFTKYALDHGAKKVIAIEKGTNQMEKPLRFDHRIELHEKTDIFDVKIAPQETPEIIVADVSFITLTAVLCHAKRFLSNENTDFLVMLKPQFEAEPFQLKSGVVKNEKIRREIIKKFESWLKNHQFITINKRDNRLKGKTGNTERFYYLKLAK